MWVIQHKIFYYFIRSMSFLSVADITATNIGKLDNNLEKLNYNM